MKRFKILLVESNEEYRERIINALSPLNCDIVEAHDGIHGIQEALHSFPDFLLANVFLPHLNGVQLMQILRVLRQQIPSILISEKKGMQKLVDFFPSVQDTCQTRQIETELLSKVNQLVMGHSRDFTDIEYELKVEEYFGLLGDSGRKKILLATGEDNNKTLMSFLKDEPYYELYLANDGQEALFKAACLKPDLIIASKELDIIEGSSVARILYILGQPIPIVFLHYLGDQVFIKEIKQLKGVLSVWDISHVMTDKPFCLGKVESALQLSQEEKQELKDSYKSVDLMMLLPEQEADFEDDPTIFDEFEDIDLD